MPLGEIRFLPPRLHEPHARRHDVLCRVAFTSLRDGSRREAVSRRAPEQRSPRRARTRVVRNLVVDPHPPPGGGPTRGSRTTCGCCGPATAPSPRTSAAASSSQPQLTGCSIISTWRGRDPDIRRNLPRSYSRTLPVLASRRTAGQARVYVMAVELVRHSDSRLDLPQLVQFLNSYQRVAPLTIAELWAWPSMLKLALVENLRLAGRRTDGCARGQARRRCLRLVC